MNLTKKNSIGQIVSIHCPYSKCERLKPTCYYCSFVSREDMEEIMNKLYNYEQTGLIFEEK